MDYLVLSRRILIVAAAALPVAACNTAGRLNLAGGGDLANSFANLGSEENVSAIAITNRKPELARQLVTYKGTERPGTVIVRTHDRKLYYVLGDGRAIRYPVGVGRAGKQWQGRAVIVSHGVV